MSKAALAVPAIREWHGLDAEQAEVPPVLAVRLSGWRRVLCVVRIAGEQEIWYATGIAGSECVGVVWQDGAEPEEYQMPLALFYWLKPWEIDRLRIPEN